MADTFRYVRNPQNRFPGVPCSDKWLKLDLLQSGTHDHFLQVVSGDLNNCKTVLLVIAIIHIHPIDFLTYHYRLGTSTAIGNHFAILGSIREP